MNIAIYFKFLIELFMMIFRVLLVIFFTSSLSYSASSNFMEYILMKPEEYMIKLQYSFQNGVVTPVFSLMIFDQKYITYINLDSRFMENGAEQCIPFNPALNLYGIKKQFKILGIEYESDESILYEVLIDKVIHHFSFSRKWRKNGPQSWKIDSVVYEAEPRRRDYAQDWADCFMQHVD